MEGKKGLPHLFNNGKPSEMSDKEFLKLLNWLDENDGIISDNNASINEKLDGSSQFFGFDRGGRNSFFWEKFGAGQRFYSENEIPEYWAGYKELFNDMRTSLEDYLEAYCINGDFEEVKVQIEVITAAGSHNPNNYEINLVPYRKDAFKHCGCLSIIQVLTDEQNATYEKEAKQEILNILDDSDYTVMAGYSLEDFEIDLSAEAMQILEFLDRYPFETESEKFGITLTEIEDLFDLPTRKYNQSTLKGLFADAKETFSNIILEQLKEKTGAFTENGMFEGLAIVLDNGMAFKVNSPDFKAAFLKHHQDAVAKKMGKVTEAKKKSEQEQSIDSEEEELEKENTEEVVEAPEETTENNESTPINGFEKVQFIIEKAPIATQKLCFQKRNSGSQFNILSEIALNTEKEIEKCKFLNKEAIIELGKKICEESGLKGYEADGKERVWYIIEIPGKRKSSIQLRQSFGGKGEAFDVKTKKVYVCKTPSATLCTAIEEGLIASLYNDENLFSSLTKDSETPESELDNIANHLLANFHFDAKADKKVSTIEQKYRPDMVKATYVNWKGTIIATVEKLKTLPEAMRLGFSTDDYKAIHPAIEDTGKKLQKILFTVDRMESKSKDIVQPSDIFLVRKDCEQYIKDDLYKDKKGLNSLSGIVPQEEILSVQNSRFENGSDELYVLITNLLLKYGILIGVSLKKITDDAHLEFIGDERLNFWTNSPDFGAAYLVYDEQNDENNTLSREAIFGNPTEKSKYILITPQHPEHMWHKDLEEEQNEKVQEIKLNIRTNGTKGAGGIDKAVVEVSFPGMEAQGGKGTAVAKMLIDNTLKDTDSEKLLSPALLSEAILKLLGSENTFYDTPTGSSPTEFYVENLKMLTLLISKSLKYYVKTSDPIVESWNAKTCFYFKIY